MGKLVFNKNLFYAGNLDVDDALPNLTSEEQTAIEMAENGISAIKAKEAENELDGEMEVLNTGVDTFGALNTEHQRHVENIDTMEVEGVQNDVVAAECAKIADSISVAAGALSIPLEDRSVSDVYNSGLLGISSPSLSSYREGVLGLGDFLKKVKDKIVSFFKMIWDKIKQFWKWLFGSKETEKAVSAVSSLNPEDAPTDIPAEEEDEYCWDVLESSLAVAPGLDVQAANAEANAVKEVVTELKKLGDELSKDEPDKKEIVNKAREIMSGNNGEQGALLKLDELKNANPTAYNICIKMMNMSRVQFQGLKSAGFSLDKLKLELAGNSTAVLKNLFGDSAIGPGDICLVDIESNSGEIANIIAVVSLRDTIFYTCPLQVKMTDKNYWKDPKKVGEIINKCKSSQDRIKQENQELFKITEQKIGNEIQQIIKTLENSDSPEITNVAATVVKESANKAIKTTKSRGKKGKALKKLYGHVVKHGKGKKGGKK